MSAEWPSIADLLVTEGPADVAILGAPMNAGSVTPGRCDLAPGVVRQALRRFGTFDGRVELNLHIADLGDLPVADVMPADGFDLIRDQVHSATRRYPFTILIGGNNAVTRPAVHGLGASLETVGLITLDAHMDMRGTEEGPRNGNPIRCLLEDGLPGRNICQIGLLPFANTMRMGADALTAGIRQYNADDVRAFGMARIAGEALEALGHVEHLVIDFDIDVIDRSQCPGAPGARPGGISAIQFFEAGRHLVLDKRVRLVDLTEFDPSLDQAEITALTAGRWVAEVLSTVFLRSRQA